MRQFCTCYEFCFEVFSTTLQIMASLIKLIEYRKYISELNDKEFSEFIFLWTKQYGRNILLTPFFNQFTSINTATPSTECIDKAIEIMKTIIQSRPTNNNNSE